MIELHGARWICAATLPTDDLNPRDRLATSGANHPKSPPRLLPLSRLVIADPSLAAAYPYRAIQPTLPRNGVRGNARRSGPITTCYPKAWLPLCDVRLVQPGPVSLA